MNTKEFLNYFPSYYFQTFCDKGIDNTLIAHGSPTNELVETIKKNNAKGAGVFFTPNKFKGQRRKDLCLGVNAWFFEIDDISKEEQLKKIENSPLKPSFVVESEKSFHVYFLADNATVENFTKIQTGLIEHFGADKACKDVSRVMRLPGFFHNKKEPFMVSVKEFNIVSYEEKIMLETFKVKEQPKKEYAPQSVEKTDLNFFEYAFNLDCMYALQKLSGSHAFKGDSIDFKPRATGGHYILCNNQHADAWIDENGRIGSGKGGGPSIIQWLEYYGHNKKEVTEIIKEYFPEVQKGCVSKVEGVSLKTIDIDDIFKELEEFNFEVLPCNNFIDNYDIFVRGSVTRIGAWSNIGKSKFSYWLASQFLKKGKKGAIFSTEVIRPLVLANIIQCLDQCHYKPIVKREKKPTQYARDLCKNISIYDGRDGTYYLSAIKELIAKHGDLDFVIIDFCQDVMDINKSENEYMRMSNYAMESQKVAQESQVCFIDLSQVSNEQAKNGANYSSGFLGLKGSGHLYSKGDIVLGLEKDVNDDSSPFVIDIKKHKYGRKERLQCQVDFSINKFFDFEVSENNKTI